MPALLLLAVLLVVGPADAAGGQTPAPTPTTAVAPSDLPAPDGSGPHLTGRPEPSLTQRVVDSLIWVWLLAVLIVAPVVWVWTGRRHRPDGGEPTPH
jgi:hypothetical protein